MKRASRWMGLTLALAGALVPVHNAEAFCGFYVSGSSEQLTNKATRVALMRYGTRTVLSMSNDYDGPPQDFAMVVPVPIVLQRDNVKTLPMGIFEHLEQLTAPRLVEYWEQDPCYVPPPQPVYDVLATRNAPTTTTASVTRTARPAVRIEAQFTVGEYNVLVLSADESTALETWLNQNHYNVPQGSAEALAPYIREQWKFFVAKVDISKVQRKPGGGSRLSPLRFHYDSPEFRLPVRLGLLNAPTKQDLIVYVLHPSSRYEVANYPNVFIPTNLDVTDAVKARFGTFYTTLFDATMQAAGGKAVVTEYAWGVGGCDPCPGPPMADGEMSTLGGDVLYNGQAPPATYHGRAYDAVVTRLHTRYDRNTLTEDLVFREAQPAVGGREFQRNANGGIEQGATVGSESYNSFQARYAIRHAWTGPVRCRHPHRGIWGGPPNGANSVTPATNLSDATRTGINLAQVVRTPLPSLGVPGTRTTGSSSSGQSQGNGVRTPQRVQIRPGAKASEQPSEKSPWAWIVAPLLGVLGFASQSISRKKQP